MIIKEIEFEDWLSMMQIIFPKYTKKAQTQHWLYDSKTHSPLALFSPTPIATLRLINRSLTINDRPAPVKGVAEVGTLPLDRNKGYGKQILDFALSKNTVYLLLTSRAKFLYPKVGFVKIDRPYVNFVARKSLEITIETISSANIKSILSSGLEIDVVSKFVILYTKFIKKFNGPLIRTDQYFQAWIIPRLERESSTITYLELNNEVKAYIITHEAPEGDLQIIIDELVYDDDRFGLALLGSLDGKKVRCQQRLLPSVVSLDGAEVNDCLMIKGFDVGSFDNWVWFDLDGF